MSDKPLILVVEDTTHIREIIVHGLERAGFRAVSAGTAMEGVRLARQEVPDLILADVNLNGQDGATAMSCLKDNAEFEDVPLILVSAMPHEQLVQKMSECGAVDFIQKPFETPKLVESVKHWLSARKGSAAEAPPVEAPKKKTFDVSTREISPGVGEVRIVGTVGISALPLVDAAFHDLFNRKTYRILINLRETGSVYSAGIGCFLAARDTAMQHGGDVIFVTIPPDLRKLFTMLGLSKLLRSAETEASALAELSSAAPPG